MEPDPILVLDGWQFLLNFVLFCLTCNSNIIIHILLIHAGYIVSVRRMVMGNIVLVIVGSTPRGVTDLYIS